MNCPVCQASGLPDELDKCPRCESDLEVFQMTSRIAKSRNNLVTVTVILSILVIAVLLFWLLSGQGSPPAEDQAAQAAISENASLKAELQKVSGEKDKLLQEVSQLKQDAASVKQDTVKRKKEYIVQNGETLFGIARKVYGNGFRYVDLARDNDLEHPEHIVTGQKLIIYY